MNPNTSILAALGVSISLIAIFVAVLLDPQPEAYTICQDVDIEAVEAVRAGLLTEETARYSNK